MSDRVREIAVVRFADAWRIVAPERSWGKYQLRLDAEEGAMRLADHARTSGQDLVVLVQQSCGELRPIRAPNLRLELSPR